MNIESLKTRVNQLIEFAEKVEATEKTTQGQMAIRYVSDDLFTEFRSAGLSFIKNTFGEDSIQFREFDNLVQHGYNAPDSTKRGKALLKAVKQEIDGGWLFTVKGLVSAEIFTDFLEMANHLLTEGYKDPAAVMIGSVLEEHLRQLCIKNGIDITVPDTKTGRDVPKKADRMNNDLTAKSVYNKLYQKTILGWLDLRNQAAHGHYTEYDIKQVKLMEDGVTDFIAKTI